MKRKKTTRGLKPKKVSVKNMPGPPSDSIPSPDDSWARVELYRWQYGELPNNDSPPLSVPKGLQAMAKAIRDGDADNFPSPYNVITVLEYASRIIEKNEK